MCKNNGSGSGKLDNSESVELEELRKKVHILESLCLPEKFKSAWEYGLSSGIFAGKNLTDELKAELYAEDLQSIIEDTLDNLEKENNGEFNENN